MPDTIRLISGSANPGFAEEILATLQRKSVKSKMVQTKIGHFPDGETKIQIQETVRGYSVYVIQPTSPPVNDNLMELCLILDALKRASAKNITAVIPYYGYSRQERKVEPRTPVSAKLAAIFIENAGAKRVVLMDIHAGATQGFFEIPVDNLYAHPIFAQALIQNNLINSKTVIVSPDIGGTQRARKLAEYLQVPLAIIEKRRNPSTGKLKLFNLIGDVKGKKAILYDDIAASGKSLIRAATLLSKAGAVEVRAAVTHGVLCGSAVRDIQKSRLKSLMLTNTIAPKPRVREGSKITRISAARAFAEAIRRIHENRSVSSLFQEQSD